MRPDLPALRTRALAQVERMRELVGHLDLVHRQLALCLYRTRGRCGKPSCHCADGPGHLRWAVGYWDSKVQHTRGVLVQQARALEPRVEAYRRFRRERAALAKAMASLLKLVDRLQRLLVDRYRLAPSRRN